MDKGRLVYEYNMMMIERYIGRSAAPIGPGKHRIVIDTSIASRPDQPTLRSLSTARRSCASPSSGPWRARSPPAKRWMSA